ncbi:hypothetical protein [Tenacibaculum mesophilum]|uniref:RteC protein n=1 Tax=Tenacibaculum mesophilum TaxID=104268 RepID=A0ABN5TB89_9FLAO|nr:hypothetical protein [Tenacibaculum mesophilum]AZJ33780.1 hypothetical protein D6200_14880 [Tenacibaculum mesophilum]QFS29024.1 hypothetical protein F9Y86_11690 [Tenacibaculum mesophilum]SHF53772.1 hypothetical protein SAMN05444344_0392 [Tenacibaculum mesophilum]
MNYGKEFIKLYNEELSAFKKVITERIEKDYGSPEMANDLYSKYNSEIQRRVNNLKEKDNIGMKESSLTGISLGYMYGKEYKFNRVENIINRDVYQYFLSNGKCSQYKNFSHFIQCFSKSLTLHSYRSFLNENRKLFYSLLDEEKANEFFNIKYIKDDLNVLTISKKHLETSENKNKENFTLQEVDKKAETKNVNLNKEKHENPFTEEEKFILIHYLFKHERSQEKKLSVYELTLILKISCGVFTDKRLEKVKDTVYEKYHKGYDYYSVSKKEKRNKLNILIDKCEAYELKVFSQYLHNQLSKI